MVPTKVIKRSKIIANPTLRRPTEAAIEAMARSIAAIGQLSPIGAIETPEGILLLYGNTRFYAAEKLGLEMMEIKIYPAGTSPEECLRISISENSVRHQMNFVQEIDALHEYSTMRGISFQEAGQELNYKDSKISKIQKMHDDLLPSSRKKLLAAGKRGSLAYQVAKEPKETQEALVDQVIAENWPRKKLELYFRQKKQGIVSFEFRKLGAKLTLEIPKTFGLLKVVNFIKEFLAELKRNNRFDLATAARRIKEQNYVVS